MIKLSNNAKGLALLHQDLEYMGKFTQVILLGRVAQSVTCLATGASLTADRVSLIRSRPGSIVSWKLIMNNSYYHSPPFRRIIQEGLLSVTSESINRLFKLVQEYEWLGELTVPPGPKLLTWDVKQ